MYEYKLVSGNVGPFSCACGTDAAVHVMGTCKLIGHRNDFCHILDKSHFYVQSVCMFPSHVQQHPFRNCKKTAQHCRIRQINH